MVSKLITFSGAFLLFVAWLAQQFLYDMWNSRLQDIAQARGAFQTYQSNNALFNALIAIAGADKHEHLQGLQMQNYRYGLSELRAALSEDRLSRLQPKIDEHVRRYRGSLPDDLAKMQGELEAIQVVFTEETRDIQHKKALAQYLFWAVYILGSLLVLTGSVLTP